MGASYTLLNYTHTHTDTHTHTHTHTHHGTRARKFYIVMELCCGDLPSLLGDCEALKAALGTMHLGTIPTPCHFLVP